MLQAKILIVEDAKDEMNSLTEFFKKNSEPLGIKCQIVTATDRMEAKQLFDRHHFHIVSLDQIMPENSTKDDRSSSQGYELAIDISKKESCVCGSIYTASDDQGRMQTLLHGTSFRYRQKGIITNIQQNCYTPDDYTKIVLKEFKDNYPLNVFSRIKDSGWADLAEYAGKIEATYRKLSTNNTNELSTLFYNEFRPFFERFIFHLAGFFDNLGRALNVSLDVLPSSNTNNSRVPPVANLIKWMDKSFSKMRKSSAVFKEFEAYFLPPGSEQNLNEYLIPPFQHLKDIRNKDTHGSINVPYDLHLERLPSLIRLLDFAGFWASTTIIYQCYKRHQPPLLEYTSLNQRFPKSDCKLISEVDFSLVPNLVNEDVYILIPNIGLTPLLQHFEVTTNDRGMVSRLDFIPWFIKK